MAGSIFGKLHSKAAAACGIVKSGMRESARSSCLGEALLSSGFSWQVMDDYKYRIGGLYRALSRLHVIFGEWVRMHRSKLRWKSQLPLGQALGEDAINQGQKTRPLGHKRSTFGYNRVI